MFLPILIYDLLLLKAYNFTSNMNHLALWHHTFPICSQLVMPTTRNPTEKRGNKIKGLIIQILGPSKKKK